MAFLKTGFISVYLTVSGNWHSYIDPFMLSAKYGKILSMWSFQANVGILPLIFALEFKIYHSAFNFWMFYMREFKL